MDWLVGDRWGLVIFKKKICQVVGMGSECTCLRNKLAKKRRNVGDVVTEFLLRGICVVVKRKGMREETVAERRSGIVLLDREDMLR